MKSESARRPMQAVAYWTELAILGFTEELLRLMDEQGVGRSELADRVGRQPSWITKVLSGENNFQIGSMARLADALGAAVHIRLAPQSARVEWTETAADELPPAQPFPALHERADAFFGSSLLFQGPIVASLNLQDAVFVTTSPGVLGNVLQVDPGPSWNDVLPRRQMVSSGDPRRSTEELVA